MTPEEFVACAAKEKNDLLATYFSSDSGAAVAQHIEALRLTTDQREQVKQVLDGALTDAFYTMLLALDGAASLGGKQRKFKLSDEDGTVLSGELEGPAWEQFQGKDSK